jgi:UDP-N-acetylmuramoyl-L-alanyl-D-glutamate--2,6-diaminopimelate ligase
MEKVPNDKGIEIIIDYAVTPDSLEKLYEFIYKNKDKCHPELVSGSQEIPDQVRNDNERKIISVFGSCGERDRGKRPMMGEIVSRFADYIILTNEDPYGEDPEQIVNEVASGIRFCHSERTLSEQSESKGKSKNLLNNITSDNNEKIPRQARNDKCFIENENFWIIMDRREAIKKALELSRPGDIFVITGKGAEEVMVIGAQRIPWNEKKVILEELKKQNH